MNTITRASILCAAAAAILFTGCKKTADNTTNSTNAINAWYAAHPSCLWPQPMQFPMQVGASDTAKTQPLDALFDANLLTRSTSEKKIIIISKQETNYDLSDTGKSNWTPDPSQPGFGNFCYGHRTVQSIVSATPNNGQPGATTQVSYLYQFSGIPGWANNVEVQNAFPQMSEVKGNGGATATLLDTPNGWQMQPPAGSNTTNPDGRIVQ